MRNQISIAVISILTLLLVPVGAPAIQPFTVAALSNWKDVRTADFTGTWVNTRGEKIVIGPCHDGMQRGRTAGAEVLSISGTSTRFKTIYAISSTTTGVTYHGYPGFVRSAGGGELTFHRNTWWMPFGLERWLRYGIVTLKLVH